MDSLIEAHKLNAVDPFAYLTSTLIAIVEDRTCF
nr:transposase domain-containing protein [Rhizobium ruizarguesonis]